MIVFLNASPLLAEIVGPGISGSLPNPLSSIPHFNRAPVQKKILDVLSDLYAVLVRIVL